MDAHSLSLARLQGCPKMGRAALTRIVERYRGDIPEGLYGRSAGWYTKELGLPARAAEALAVYTPHVDPGIDRLPIRLVTRFDRGFPHSVLSAEHPPPVLSVHGAEREGLTGGKAAVLASFGWELDHTDAVKAVIETCIRHGFALIAGHNRPVYQWALLAAKRNQSQSVMVLDRGMLSAFDPDLRRDPVIAARIWGYGFDDQRCQAISPFRLCDGWKASHGPWRDDIVAALADTIIVMGCRPRGITEALCVRAAKLGKRIFAGPDTDALLECNGVERWNGEMGVTAIRLTRDVAESADGAARPWGTNSYDE